ncbi:MULTISPECIES: aromatic ring-hydroxylating dioxygenase subunit alpha [unclassified Synechocystis]|uniref:aromatic ring-hydroxylating dioxygenase subunit alpha n=1 Tax=unclassified Synechocystis TaxID=2640012 RepID=UPI0003FBF2A8|nr:MULTISPECIES: aromatic ring-hydroxylating dioxygenase subunit alpha [unclassified Synechocystis]AIE74163.1 phenoxybenzoate dioxygenase [Synechocystis sp. PCC 6714]MCT0252799.1 aromatic ring-hydroxylating dioxygenase subunit alpha [Synechocystis sp. CS-94]
MQFEDFWYVVAHSEQLKPGQIIARQILGQWLAIFRTQNRLAIAVQDRCVHRHGRLSCGSVEQGNLHCPYHGWVYDQRGKVIAVPSEGQQFKPRENLQTKCYRILEQEGLIYVCLGQPSKSPFALPRYGEKGWHRIRLIHQFANGVTNCVENFIDIPHTASVHPGIFRTAQRQAIQMTVSRHQGEVKAEYHNEKNNLGWWSRFLNPRGNEITHTDQFIMPNVTSVEYKFSPQRHLFITSQSVPETEQSTLVYTDIAFNYGNWNYFAIPFIWWTAKRIIAQDLKILAMQQQVIAKYGSNFNHTPADTIHIFVESIRTAIAKGEDPRDLPDKTVEVTFYV